MPNYRRTTQVFFVLLVILIVNLACALSAPTGEDPGSAVQTRVAATLAANTAGEASPAPEEDAPEPLSSPNPATETPTAPEPDVVYEGISFSFDEQIMGELSINRAEGVLEADHPWKMPDHISFTFEEYVLPEGFHQAQIRVFSVEDFKAVNAEAGSRLDRMQEKLASDPVNPDEFFVVHFWNAMRYFVAQGETLEFQNGRGVRYISQYGQAAMPIGYPEMFYTFQGLTDDGAYYVSVIVPVSHPSLPETEGVTLDDSFYENWENYLQETQDQLDGQAPESFVPSLLELDGMVASLRVNSE